jgi:hypothetical protein
MVNLSISCLTDLCFFISDFGRKQAGEQGKEEKKDQKKSRKRLNGAPADQPMAQEGEADAAGQVAGAQ